MKGVATNRWVEITLIAVGRLLRVLAPRGNAWQGVGAGLAAPAGLVLLPDAFAERCAAAYVAWLLSLWATL